MAGGRLIEFVVEVVAVAGDRKRFWWRGVVPGKSYIVWSQKLKFMNKKIIVKGCFVLVAKLSYKQVPVARSLV